MLQAAAKAMERTLFGTTATKVSEPAIFITAGYRWRDASWACVRQRGRKLI